MQQNMKKTAPIIALMALILLAGCNSNKKINTYENIYSEKPVTIYIAPIQDHSTRKPEKYPKDIDYNNELNTATNYLTQTMSTPLINQGYYVIGVLASQQIAKQQNHTAKQLMSGDLKIYAQLYGIDAVLTTTIHRWVEKNGEWILFIEYALRSTKSNNDLMHTWVKAVKQIPTDLKGDPIILKSDRAYAAKMNFDNGTAQRCFLVQQVNDYVLRNLPTSSVKRQFERDRYARANEAYFTYYFTPEGEIEIENSTMESFEEDCFVE